MPEQADSRRMQLLEILAESQDPIELEALAKTLSCDTRTVRRDVDALQNLLQRLRSVEIQRGKVNATRSGFGAGYFTAQMERGFDAKAAIAKTIVDSLPENSALTLTAGSTPYAVAREIRHRAVNDLSPHNLIVFTNSLPALIELASANISTGILGEIYAPDDCAFHTPEFHSAFQPSIAIVGASGVLLGDTLDLFSHRAEEAAFLKRLLKDIPEIVLAVDHTKLGKRHPWSFGGATLAGKSVRLVTDALSDAQCDSLEHLRSRLLEQEINFCYEIASPLS